MMDEINFEEWLRNIKPIVSKREKSLNVSSDKIEEFSSAAVLA